METSEDPVTRRAKARVGTLLRDKWHLDELIGVGGMAAVYKATHRNGKRGAVKMLHLEISVDPNARTRFLREGYVSNKVEHPGAVSIIDDDVADDGSVFIVMELLEGETLDARAATREGTRLSTGEVLELADQVLRTLEAAHDKGIVHRDIKPENLFVTHDGHLKILDFGIARVRDVTTSSATRTGSAMGTPAYMPPEQALGEWSKVDGRSDLWSVGATMFTLLTGRQVHDAETLQKLLLCAMTRPAPPIASILPTVDPTLATVIDRALSFEPEDRFADARAMRQALEPLRSSMTASGVGLGARVLAEGASGAGPRLPRSVVHANATSAPVSTESGASSPRRGARKGARKGWFVGVGIAVAGAAIAAFVFRDSLVRHSSSVEHDAGPASSVAKASPDPIPAPPSAPAASSKAEPSTAPAAPSSEPTPSPSESASAAPVSSAPKAWPRATPRATTTQAPAPPPSSSAKSNPFDRRM